MLMTIAEAREVLRLSTDDNDTIIMALLEAIPPYIETATGSTTVVDNPTMLEIQVAKFILMQWYDPANENAERIQKVIDTLLKTISVNVEKN